MSAPGEPCCNAHHCFPCACGAGYHSAAKCPKLAGERVADFDARAVEQDGRRRRRGAQARGYRLQRLVRHALEVEGAQVEVARKALVWKIDPDHPARPPLPMSVRHDWFGCWDMVAVFADGRRSFVQVTTLTNVAPHRLKIIRSGFPATRDDAILAHERGRVFRELRGPGFQMPGRSLTLPPLPRNPLRRRGARRET